jgi:hypothetical protein
MKHLWCILVLTCLCSSLLGQDNKPELGIVKKKQRDAFLKEDSISQKASIENLVIEGSGKFYIYEFWPSGNVRFKTSVEVYFADGLMYRINPQTGVNEEIEYKLPAYRYHGLRLEFDESGKKVIMKNKYKHGVLRKTKLFHKVFP